MKKHKGILKRKFGEQAGRCGICREEMDMQSATLDHIIPVAALKREGLKPSFMKEYNLQAVHMRCNVMKSDGPLSRAIGLVYEQ